MDRLDRRHPGTDGVVGPPRHRKCRHRRLRSAVQELSRGVVGRGDDDNRERHSRTPPTSQTPSSGGGQPHEACRRPCPCRDHGLGPQVNRLLPSSRLQTWRDPVNRTPVIRPEPGGSELRRPERAAVAPGAVRHPDGLSSLARPGPEARQGPTAGARRRSALVVGSRGGRRPRPRPPAGRRSGASRGNAPAPQGAGAATRRPQRRRRCARAPEGRGVKAGRGRTSTPRPSWRGHWAGRGGDRVRSPPNGVTLTPEGSRASTLRDGVDIDRRGASTPDVHANSSSACEPRRTNSRVVASGFW